MTRARLSRNEASPPARARSAPLTKTPPQRGQASATLVPAGLDDS